MFPGQGSQARGMGEDLFDEFSDLTQKADKILGYSIKELCLEDPRRELNKTQFTQPAIYVVNALSYYKKIKDTGVKPNYVMGHSLGEFNALLAAECYSFESGLKLVKKRGELMSKATDGGMAAILNSSKAEIEKILEENNLSNIDLANFNTPSQIVISGSREEIGLAEPFFQKGEILYYPLNTSGAFHSRFMQPSSDKFASYLKKFKFSDTKIPVLSNVTARPYKKNALINNLSKQIASGVRWSESVQYLMKLAEDKNKVMEFEEIGFNDVLTKIIDTIKREVSAIDAAHSEEVSEVSEVAVSSTENRVKTEVEENTIKVEKVEALSNPLTADEIVASWNSRHPIGTKVKSIVTDDSVLETRTEAVVLFGHRAAVYMKNYKGYFDLNEITPVG